MIWRLCAGVLRGSCHVQRDELHICIVEGYASARKRRPFPFVLSYQASQMSAWKSNCVSPFILCSLVLFYTLSAFIEVYFLFLFGGIRKHLLSLSLSCLCVYISLLCGAASHSLFSPTASDLWLSRLAGGCWLVKFYGKYK